MRVAVTLVGRRVHQMMEKRCEGATIAVFRRSLYIRDAHGAVACLGVPGVGAGPLNALCDGWPDEPIGTGLATSWADQVLDISGRWQFDLSAATIWRPAPLPRICRVADGLRLLAEVAASEVPSRGLGRTINTLLGSTPWLSDDPFERAGGEGVIALARWLTAPAAEPPSAMARLIGLGPGLTPSGDDALGGALIAARAFDRADVADRLAGWVLPRAKAATSDISFAHLAAAADGEGAAALHETLAALSRADRSDLTTGLRHIDAIGHSSGWDGLAGAVAALTALCAR